MVVLGITWEVMHIGGFQACEQAPLPLGLEELWWGHDPLEVYKAENGRQWKAVLSAICLPGCWTAGTITASNHTDMQQQQASE